MSVGVMKGSVEKVKFRDLHVLHTRVWSWHNRCPVDIQKDSVSDQHVSDYPSGPHNFIFVFVYYESKNQELNRRLIYECRCDERLKVKTEESTRLSYTWITRGTGSLEHQDTLNRREVDECDGCVRSWRERCVVYIQGNTSFCSLRENITQSSTSTGRSTRHGGSGTGHWYNTQTELVVVIIRVKRELKRVYRNGCRYHEILTMKQDLKRLTHTELQIQLLKF